MIDYKLHIPGPVNVSAETYQAMSTPVMGHRSSDFVELSNYLGRQTDADSKWMIEMVNPRTKLPFSTGISGISIIV